MIVSLKRIDANQEAVKLGPGSHVIGRVPSLRVTDQKVSRMHAEILLLDGNCQIKALHSNPCYFKKANQLEVKQLRCQETINLADGDEIGLLRNQYWYTVNLLNEKNEVSGSTEPNASQCVQPGGVNDDNGSVIQVAPVTKIPCYYGKFCFRKNPAHFSDYSHPGDRDFVESSIGQGMKPKCKYGRDCYQKSEDHRKVFSHPRRYKIRKIETENPGSPRSSGYSDFDEDEDNDEFSTDDDSDALWEPSDEDKKCFKENLKETESFFMTHIVHADNGT